MYWLVTYTCYKHSHRKGAQINLFMVRCKMALNMHKEIQIFHTIKALLVIIKGLFILWEEDPITRKVLRGRRTFQWVYMLKFWSVWLPSTFVEEELKKKAGKNNKNAICNLQLSLLVLITTVQQNYHNYQLMAINHKTKWSAIIAMITNTCTDFTCLHHHCLVCP